VLLVLVHQQQQQYMYSSVGDLSPQRLRCRSLHQNYILKPTPSSVEGHAIALTGT
jgi:hypothetical protein